MLENEKKDQNEYKPDKNEVKDQKRSQSQKMHYIDLKHFTTRGAWLLNFLKIIPQ